MQFLSELEVCNIVLAPHGGGCEWVCPSANDVLCLWCLHSMMRAAMTPASKRKTCMTLLWYLHVQ